MILLGRIQLPIFSKTKNIHMKKAILLLSSLFVLTTSSLVGQYSNASWNGPWIISGNGIQNYLVFNGSGLILEAGKIGATGGQGTYSINPAGIISGTIVYGVSTVPFTGSFSNDSTATISVGLSFTVNKVKNLGAAGGVWGNQLDQTVGGTSTKNMTFEVDANGDVVNASGFTGPVSGKVYATNGKVAGLINTGESAPWNQIQLNGTSFTGTSMSGTMDLTGSSANAFSLTQQSGLSSNELNSSKVQPYPNPVNTQFSIEGLSSGTLNIYDVLGNNVSSIIITASKTTLDVDVLGLSQGVYFYSVAGNENVQGKFIVE